MAKKIFALVLALVMAFSFVIPTFAVVVKGDTVEAAAVSAATYAYMRMIDESGKEDADYDSFTVTKSIKQTDADGKVYYDVTLRANNVYKYTCKVYGYSVSVVGVPVSSKYSVDTDTATLEETSYFMGLLGTLIDQVFTMFTELLNTLISVEK